MSYNILHGLSESVSNSSNGHSRHNDPNLKHQKPLKYLVNRNSTALFYRFFLEVKYFIIISTKAYPILYLTLPKVLTVKSYEWCGNLPNLGKNKVARGTSIYPKNFSKYVARMSAVFFDIIGVEEYLVLS